MKNKMSEQIMRLLMAILLLFSMAVLAREASEYVRTSSMAAEKTKKLCVVIDPGHGGFDPGKVGVNGVEEKDLNLIIAKKLKDYLEQRDIEVILTRETEAGLYDEGSSNKKVQDMKRRIVSIEEANPLMTVSIHQNSYQEEKIKGAQVFYYSGSEEGKALAEWIQTSMVERLDPSNHRAAKANDSYYMLTKTKSPIVIVECGFLSNWEEAEKLCTEEYQDKAAWAIHMGVMQYLSEVDF